MNYLDNFMLGEREVLGLETDTVDMIGKIPSAKMSQLMVQLLLLSKTFTLKEIQALSLTGLLHVAD